MNEDEYLRLTHPQILLERTRRWGEWKCRICSQGKTDDNTLCRACQGRGRCPRTTERKLRLIACACYRFDRDELEAFIPYAAIEAAERFSEGDASAASVLASLRGDGAVLGGVRSFGRGAAVDAIRFVQVRSWSLNPQRLARTLNARINPAFDQAERSAKAGAVALHKARHSIIRQFRLRDEKEVERLLADDRRRLCDLIRDVLGNPYRPVTVEPAWLDGNRGLARTIATEIAEEGRFSDVPILADALEEAGCSDERILSHARQPRHYRGCWLIDSILGKS